MVTATGTSNPIRSDMPCTPWHTRSWQIRRSCWSWNWVQTRSADPCRHNAAGLWVDTIDTSQRPAAPTAKREWNLIIDERWCARLGLAQGDRLTARQFCDRLAATTDEISSIYPEETSEKTADRLRRLRSGVALFRDEMGSPQRQPD